MLRKFSQALLVALTIGGGAFAGGVAPASADDFGVSVSERGIELVQYRDRDFRRGGRGYDRCEPRRALRKARELGVRDADIVRDNRRAVVVDGFRRGRPITVRFAQERGCPVLGVR